jgi:hypothetical protein
MTRKRRLLSIFATIEADLPRFISICLSLVRQRRRESARLDL